jgi:hypothetical protein
MTELMTLNEFIADIAENELRDYIENKYYDNEMSLDEMNEYFDEGNYGIHLDYLMETWTNYINEEFVNNFIIIDYNRQGTFNELWDYFVGLNRPIMFQNRWLDDIFERYILDTAVCLK